MTDRHTELKTQILATLSLLNQEVEDLKAQIDPLREALADLLLAIPHKYQVQAINGKTHPLPSAMRKARAALEDTK